MRGIKTSVFPAVRRKYAELFLSSLKNNDWQYMYESHCFSDDEQYMLCTLQQGNCSINFRYHWNPMHVVVTVYINVTDSGYTTRSDSFNLYVLPLTEAWFIMNELMQRAKQAANNNRNGMLTRAAETILKLPGE